MSTLTARRRLDRRAAQQLRRSLRGGLVLPGDASYAERRRVWNGSIDRSPAAIAGCADASDVVTALRFAREHDLPVAVRGGGHSFPGHSVCDDGLVVDLSPMTGVRVDPEARTVRVRAGTLLGELDAATQRHAMAVTCGIVSHTGVAGLTLGGGLGWTMRRFGLTVDHLLAVRMVTAEGETVRADATENAELFWGVRGGGGNFGVVTDFEFRLDAVGPTVVAGGVYWPMEEAPRLLRFYRDWAAGCPDALTTIVVQRRMLDLPGIPRDLVGRHVVAVVACYAGPVDEGEQVLRPLTSFGRPLLDLCRPQPYLVHQTGFDAGFPHGWWYHLRACDLAGLSDEVVDVMAEYGRRIVSPVSSVALWQMGGAVARVGATETAFSGRDAAFTVNINGNSRDGEGFEAEREWARAYWSALAPFHHGVYVNFLMDEGATRVRQAYPPATYQRLSALKAVWDPENVFRHNQNIPPAAAPPSPRR